MRVYLVALLVALALLAWFGWDLSQPLRADVRSRREDADRDDGVPPCPTPHWHNPGVDDGRR
jgi:hypothetical protein